MTKLAGQLSHEQEELAQLQVEHDQLRGASEDKIHTLRKRLQDLEATCDALQVGTQGSRPEGLESSEGPMRGDCLAFWLERREGLSFQAMTRLHLVCVWFRLACRPSGSSSRGRSTGRA